MIRHLREPIRGLDDSATTCQPLEDLRASSRLHLEVILVLFCEMRRSGIDAVDHFNVLRTLRLKSTLEIAFVIYVCATAANKQQGHSRDYDEIGDAHGLALTTQRQPPESAGGAQGRLSNHPRLSNGK